MAKEACDALAVECNSGGPQSDGPATLVFLVGGAGNGKSELARDFLSQVKATRITPASRFSQRKYEFKLPKGSHLTVVNDATIPPEEATEEGPLAEEISNAISSQSYLLACVNRGVLIGEAKQGLSGGGIQDSVIKWLLSATGSWPADGTQIECEKVDKGHYRFARLSQDAEAIASIHVVFMDYLSLLESSEGSGSASSGLSSPLEAKQLALSPILGRDHEAGGDAAFAGPLSKAAASFLAGVAENSLDPIRANAEVLARPKAAGALCAVFRGAEILAGSHFTYRDLWAFFSHALVGSSTPASYQRLAKWLGQKADEASSADPKEHLAAMMALASLRTHMVLFDAGVLKSQITLPSENFDWATIDNDALHAIRSIDPLKDFGPSSGSEYNTLLDRLTGIEDGKLPSELIKAEWPGFASHWTEFDTKLEQAVSNALDPNAGKSELHYRNRILGWYGRYMFRLVATANGWPAHCSLVSRWQYAWNLANRSKRLEKEIERSVLSIVLPEAEGSNETYFPILRSRVETLRESDRSVTIEVPRNKFGIKATANGDSIILELEASGSENVNAAQTVLDFHLLREALSRNGNHGFTDSLAVIEPRLERIRASVLATQIGSDGQGQNYRVTYRGGQAEVFS
ncbi:hypothetical protein [Qipengyuania psychrotolerans]|uniref:Uncharacterized protein n=1 Tax=Qipengyuania psychrotolerans TaxID=2867238 RepID=A0ABX8ZCK3_9SPHN|nr:hypothetical protein [Qipengyuania psychrotolerans]QZD86725.1 hypothetical protein K3166_11005 [Qipengyuania psychrotolerans]